VYQRWGNEGGEVKSALNGETVLPQRLWQMPSFRPERISVYHFISVSSVVRFLVVTAPNPLK
jgi:hypothetical protein